MSDVNVIDLVKYASDNKPMDFTAALDAVLGQKALEALETRKQELAVNLFKDNDPEDTENEDEELEQIQDDVLDDESNEFEEEDLEEIEDEKSEDTGESDDQP